MASNMCHIGSNIVDYKLKALCELYLYHLHRSTLSEKSIPNCKVAEFGLNIIYCIVEFHCHDNSQE